MEPQNVDIKETILREHISYLRKKLEKTQEDLKHSEEEKKSLEELLIKNKEFNLQKICLN